ncbi:superoxide dismutase [Streptomyces albofaciens]|uniref:superoxide dismutase n=1 Tax=Streptomyces albofaciens TaxID=66866 RepID=UPI00142EF0FC|nr:superoxide dismutase [Streptomyces albofaciens]
MTGRTRGPAAAPRALTRRKLLATGAALGAGAALGPAAPASARTAATPGRTVFRLPDGFRPGCAADGRFGLLYFGSLHDGSVHRVDPATGDGALVHRGTGGPAVALQVNWQTSLFVAGGASGELRVIEGGTGAVRGVYPLGGAAAYASDLIGVGAGHYVSDAARPCVHLLPYGPSGSLPPPPGGIVTLPLTGEWVQGDGPTATGITYADDGGLIVLNSAAGALYRVDPKTGDAVRVPHHGPSLCGGDGLCTLGGRLHVVRPELNAVDVLRLDPATGSTTVGRLTDPDLDAPGKPAVDRSRTQLCVPNTRRGTPPTPTTPYTALSLPLGDHSGSGPAGGTMPAS